MPLNYDHDHEHEVTLFAETNFRNQNRRFGIKTDDRRRHMYVLGKTGMGKTVLQENMVMSDVMAGHGVCYIDPHGDTAEKLLDMIPSNRINDVVYFNPADMEYPVGFNILETTNEEQKHLVASGLMGVFKKIWPDVWSPRMEYILLNCVLALLDYPGATLLGINRLLVDKEYRARVIAKIRNPIVKTFWVAEFTSWSEKYATEAIAPVQNKVGQFLSASIIRNIVAQVKSSINPRQIMDEGKIFIVNLSKGKIGEDNMRLLGGMIVTKIQLAAMERVDIKNEDDRRDFYLFVDEFQNFANESFASVLSEARKYHLNLTVAHQYIEQLTEEVRDAVFGNVGTMIMFRVGAPDATFLETEFTPTFLPEDLTNLAKYQIYLKLMVDGVSTQPFSANTLPPIAKRTGSEAKVIAVSRERYSEPRAVIEEKVLRWSGMETSSMSAMPGTTLIPGLEYPAVMTEEEQAQRESLGGVTASLRSSIAAETAIAGVAALEGAAAVEDTGEYLRISPERMAALAKPGAQPKKDKPKFKHTCTRCGKTWDMPIQLDASRPMYCAECMPLMREERKGKQKIMKEAVHADGPVDLGAGATEPMAVPTPRGASSLEAAMRDVEQGTPIRSVRRPDAYPAGAPPRPPRQESPPANRPRLVVTDTDQLERLTADDEEDEDRSELLQDVARATGRPVETRKQFAVPPKAAPAEQRPAESPRASYAPPNAGSDRNRDQQDRRVSSYQQPNGAASRPGQGGAQHRAVQGSRNRNEGRRQDMPPRLAPGNTPRIVRDTPRVESVSTPRPEKKPRTSLEDLFREAEERTERTIERKPAAGSFMDGDGEAEKHPTTVFRTPQPVNRSEAPVVLDHDASKPRPIAPGQRVRFDE